MTDTKLERLQDWLTTTIAAIEEMGADDPPIRHLSRSTDGSMIHRDTCVHARVPWQWADTVNTDEILEAIARFEYHCCRLCKPGQVF